MLKYLIFLLSFLLLTSCGSPINHKVEGEQKTSSFLSFKTFNLQIETRWLEGPVGNINTDNQLMVIVKNQSNQLVSLPNGYSLNFYATMPEMGHPLDDPGFFEMVNEGIYINKTIRYNMSGKWKNELWIIDDASSVKDKVIWDEFF
ncbi:MAG: hypothetical protein KDD34_08570 [Bdellovibrionales bacterium]|nr:hypothetical protein [Bdellovibrionales bacterium]